ncbi:sugar phosphate isomerase/epimerase [Streptomyces sp. DT2A-34]|uniref:sugar phosphate isomerase/epimerase family protein n=1 Tax=Streptomyces sp. DT2A-34 TaxID=3051182 RepID=UPI00265C5C82|nr:sugar phosphate isomerase/epimerase [Streptomyces sp. DT2A-34]MDO0909438.1 sugar phosphate isomerase/epimerase [Streptomyces sp. DT2A-34]
MKIGLNTDSVGHLTLDETLDLAAELGLDHVEFATGAWSTAPHIDIDRLLDSDGARRELLAKVADRGLTISALTCSGNPLHPGPSGREHDQVARRTIALAPLLGIDRVVMMSGLPGGPGDANPNWITVSWPPETTQILDWQWTEVVIPYWRDLVAHSRDRGVPKLALEMHAHQVVYNVPTLLRLREEVGPVVGANFDPSHLMWMGADPLAAIETLGEAIYHVHAKDTRLEPSRQALTSRLETLPVMAAKDRSWNYVTLGYGHDDAFWRAFCLALRRAGYDDVLSIEHEDVLVAPVEGVTKTVDLLRRVMLRDPSSYKPQEI